MHYLMRVTAEFGVLPLVAEDLGIIAPEVEKLRDDHGLPGMKVLHFAFGGAADNPIYRITRNQRRCLYWHPR